LSEARTSHGKQQNRSMHGFNGDDDANRYGIAGQFASHREEKSGLNWTSRAISY